MDKTRNKIFVGCLALLLVMVAGYALFSQNLTINGTAKAQGDFSLVTTCQPGIPDNLKNIENFLQFPQACFSSLLFLLLPHLQEPVHILQIHKRRFRFHLSLSEAEYYIHTIQDMVYQQQSPDIHCP